MKASKTDKQDVYFTSIHSIKLSEASHTFLFAGLTTSKALLSATDNLYKGCDLSELLIPKILYELAVQRFNYTLLSSTVSSCCGPFLSTDEAEFPFFNCSRLLEIAQSAASLAPLVAAVMTWRAGDE